MEKPLNQQLNQTVAALSTNTPTRAGAKGSSPESEQRTPTPEETQAFIDDRSPDAYERQVDRLLASPHYGERWGRHWLDIAHYADSNGYNIDGSREIWMYCDWVIDVFNCDMFFD